MNHTTHRFPVCDLFASIQGEGTWTGRAMVFVRFFGCPLSCPWCDEPRRRDPEAVRNLTTTEILEEIARIGPDIPHVLLTGGEPLAVDGLSVLIRALKKKRYWVAMETSGVGGTVPPGLDWLTLSPKTPLPEGTCQTADEIKFVVGPVLSAHEARTIHQRAAIHPNVWVQPRADGDRLNLKAVARCIEQVMAAGGRVRLSLQIHKWIDVP